MLDVAVWDIAGQIEMRNVDWSDALLVVISYDFTATEGKKIIIKSTKCAPYRGVAVVT